MFIDRSKLEQFPFYGEFYINGGIDPSLPPTEQTSKEEIIFTTKCDVQGNARSNNSSFYFASYIIDFPFDKKEGIKVKMGQKFRCNSFGVEIDGDVIAVVPNQLNICSAYIKDANADTDIYIRK